MPSPLDEKKGSSTPNHSHLNPVRRRAESKQHMQTNHRSRLDTDTHSEASCAAQTSAATHADGGSGPSRITEAKRKGVRRLLRTHVQAQSIAHGGREETHGRQQRPSDSAGGPGDTADDKAPSASEHPRQYTGQRRSLLAPGMQNIAKAVHRRKKRTREQNGPIHSSQRLVQSRAQKTGRG